MKMLKVVLKRQNKKYIKEKIVFILFILFLIKIYFINKIS